MEIIQPDIISICLLVGITLKKNESKNISSLRRWAADEGGN